jgi:hypothetical protein
MPHPELPQSVLKQVGGGLASLSDKGMQENLKPLA